MPPESSPSQRPDRPAGFILLHTLILLLVGSALVAVSVGIGLGRTRDADAEHIARRLELAAESGVQDALFQLVAKEGKRGKDIGKPWRVTIDGFEVELSIQFADGLVGLNSADRRPLREVLAMVLGSRGSLAAHSLSGSGPLSSYAELTALEGIGVAGVSCLLPYVTLNSNSGSPVPKHAPAKLRNLLSLPSNDSVGAIEDANPSVMGAVLRIEARAESLAHRSRRLLVEAMLTGRTDRPVVILEWFWVPGELGGESGNKSC